MPKIERLVPGDSERQRISWFFYGHPGSGKTTVAATFPAPLFVFPVNEGSVMTLENHPPSEPVDYVILGRGRERVIDEFEALLVELEQAHARAMGLLAKGKESEALKVFPWQTLVIDGLTHFGDLIISDLGGPTAMMTQQQWGIFSGFFRSLHSRLSRLDVDIVYTSLARVTETAEGFSSGGPWVAAQVGEKLPASCDVISYLECEDRQKAVHYMAYFRKHKHWIARSRFPWLPKSVEDFSYSKAIQLWDNYRKERKQSTEKGE